MQFLSAQERETAIEIGSLVYANPFLEERIAHEKRIIGAAYVESQPFWSLRPDLQRKDNIDAIDARCSALVETLHARLRGGARASRDEMQVYDDLVIYFLYER